MLRPILFVWVLILVPKTCLWAQDTSPGNAQGCDPRELTELLRPTDPAYAESIELTREMEHRGYTVRCVLRSKMENFFEGQLGAALYRTNRGDFEALFLTKPRTFDSVCVVERFVKGEVYHYSFEGSPHSTGMDGRRTFFARRTNRFFMTFDMRLAADLGEVLNPISKQSLAISLLRAINTAEVTYQHENGSFTKWQTLLSGEPKYFDKFLAIYGPERTNPHFADAPEILPGWNLRLNVHSDAQGYDVLLQDMTDEKCGYAVLTDESGVIRQSKAINCNI